MDRLACWSLTTPGGEECNLSVGVTSPLHSLTRFWTTFAARVAPIELFWGMQFDLVFTGDYACLQQYKVVMVHGKAHEQWSKRIVGIDKRQEI